MPETTFGDAIFVPALQAACCAALDDHVIGSGLKLMRLVARVFGEEMLSRVTRFKVFVGACLGPLDPAAAGIVSRCRLVLLDVSVNITEDAETRAAGSCQQLMSAFVHSALAGLSTVRELHFSCTFQKDDNDVPAAKRDTLCDFITDMLCGLAVSMPSLSHLKLDGPAGVQCLQRISKLCPLLSSLDVQLALHHLPTIRLLSSHFPAVTSLRFHGTGTALARRILLLESLRALNFSSSIQHLDLGLDCPLDEELFKMLPPNLVSLVTDSPALYDGMVGCRMITKVAPFFNLSHATLNCSLGDVVRFCVVAPSLRVFDGEVYCTGTYDLSMLRYWKWFSHRLDLGLVVTRGMSMFTRDPENLHEFLKIASPLASIRSLSLKSSSRVSSMSVQFIARVFPNLLSLKLTMCVGNKQLPALLSCKKLTHLEFIGNDIIIMTPLMMLLSNFPSLKTVSIAESCGNIHKGSVVQLLKMFNVQVTLI